MHLFSQLERLAAEGGYSSGGRDISRVTVADVHKLHASLARTNASLPQDANLAVARLRRWIVYGDGMLPPVRGAAYLHANREVWIAFADCEEPAVLRGRPSAFNELRRCLVLSANPDYHGFLRVKTNPSVEVVAHNESITLTSSEGVVRLTFDDAIHVEHWLSIALRPRDRHGVLLLPTPWGGRGGN